MRPSERSADSVRNLSGLICRASISLVSRYKGGSTTGEVDCTTSHVDMVGEMHSRMLAKGACSQGDYNEGGNGGKRGTGCDIDDQHT